MADVDLPDLNVWFALSVPEHAHHARARAYWELESADRVALCSQTIVGLARLLSTVSPGGARLSPTAAWTMCRNWLSEANVLVAAEPQGCHATLDSYVSGGCVRPKTWPDAYLAAFAKTGNMRLVSFDSDFASFPQLDWLHLVD